MEDKEIIIDSVDVSGCKHYEKRSFYNCNETFEDNGGIICINCEDNPNCYFKQLARKNAECEELKEKIRIKDDENSNLNKKYRQEQAEKISYRKALEGIEDIMQNHIINDFSNWNMGEIGDDIFAYCVTANCKQILAIITKAKDINVPHKKEGE